MVLQILVMFPISHSFSKGDVVRDTFESLLLHDFFPERKPFPSSAEEWGFHKELEHKCTLLSFVTALVHNHVRSSFRWWGDPVLRQLRGTVSFKYYMHNRVWY